MGSFFRKLFRKRNTATAQDSDAAFAARLHRFRLFLSAYLDAYSEIMTFEERLADEMPFGMPFLRMCTARLTVATMQCVLQLNTLGEGRFTRLDGPFSTLRSEVQTILEQGATPLDGPLIIPYNAVGDEHSTIVSPNLYKLRTIREAHPEFMPRGFVITGAAWWRYFNDPDMHDEIDRIMIISQDDPGSYGEASATIRERMSSSFPLPEELETAIKQALAGYPEMETPGHSVLIRCLPVQMEHGALVIPEQVLHTPVDAKNLLHAIRASFTMAYRPRAILYRLKRGIRDRAMPFCISVTLIPEVHGRGSGHRKLETLNPEELFIHIRRGFSTPESWPSQATDEGASLPEEALERIKDSLRTALDSLADAPVRGNRHEIFWAASEQGRLYVLGVNALPDPFSPSFDEPEEKKACLCGGISTYPGLVQGQVHLVRNYTDALSLPIGSILILQQASPRWSFLHDFASGAVAGDGTGNGMFARTARRYGRPTVLRQPEAFSHLESGQCVRLEASADHEPFLCVLNEEKSSSRYAQQETVPGAAFPIIPPDDSADPKQVHAGERPAPLWLPDSSLAEMARELAPRVVSLTLPDSDHVDFRAENCKTFHDIINYCHVHAVREMFRAGTTRKTASAPAKQLISTVPTQFWLINMGDGFYTDIKGPVVHLEEVASIPMRSLWEGFTDKPWEGPPQLNAKGFLSVLFEASANPNLDPASQSSQYTEKNVFLIAKRFCSMRCRFGFHFLSMDCLLGERPRERFIIFQFKGGAANLARRIRRVHFVAELLSQFDFATEIVGDTLTARLEKGEEREFLSALRVLGYITMHTRQLDMIMGDERALAAHRFQMLEDMLALASREPAVVP